MTLQELEKIKENILSQQCMDQYRKSPRVTVGLGACGIKAGAAAVLEEFRKQLAGTEGPVVVQVGCVGLCSYEPVVEVAVPGEKPVIYGHMSPEKARKVASEHILGGKPVEKWILTVTAR